MIPRFPLLIPFVVLTLTIHPLAKADCYIKAINLIGETNLAIILRDLKPLELPGSLKAHFEQFQHRFNLLYAMPSKERQNKDLKNALLWAEQVNRKFTAYQQKLLRQAIRRWMAIILRDVSPILKEKEQQLIAKRIRSLENTFAQKAPLLISTFCMDKEFAKTSEDAKTFHAMMQQLKEQQILLKQNAKEMEVELIQRLENHPAFADHWYHYASFLLARGRLEETEVLLQQMLKNFPHNKKGTLLLKDVKAIKGISNPLEQAKIIERIMAFYLNKATREYRAKKSRTPAATPSAKPTTENKPKVK